MNTAVKVSCERIEQALGKSPAFRRIDERLFVVKQGSAYVMITVLPWGEDRAVVRCAAQLVKGSDVTGELALALLKMNAMLRFGAFGFIPEGKLIVLSHAILGGETLDDAEILATVRDIALLADEYDDKLVRTHGGARMQDLLEDAAYKRILDTMDRGEA